MGPNKSSGEDRTITLNFTEDSGNYTAPLSFATVEDDSDPENDGEGTITITLEPDTNDPAKYTVSEVTGEDTAMVTVIEVPVPELTIHIEMVETNEGTPAAIMVRASEDPKQPFTFKYTPTEAGTTEYLAPVTEEGSTTPKESGDERTVTLVFCARRCNS